MTNLHYNNQYLGFCDPPTSLFPPNTDNQFYNSLSSIWNDGTPLTYGGKGYDTSSIAFTNYAFPENPNDPNAWSMIAPGQYFICEIHTIMTTTKDTLHAGDEFILDGAHSFHRQPGATNLGNINVALTNIPLIQAFYDSGYNSECSQTQLCQSDCVWPGDANRDGIAKNDDLLYLGLAAGSGGTGPQRLVQSHQWMPQNADNWNLALANGQDYKNADFNGDGLLDSLDLGVLDFNYKKAVPGYIPPPQIEAPFQSNQLYLAINKDEISAANFPYRIIISASLASEDFPIEELYGLAFTLKFDTSIWELPPPTWPFPVPSPYNNNLFGENAMYIGKTDAKEGTIDVAFSKKDGQSIQDAHGVLCKIDLYIRQNAPTGNPNGMQALSFKVYDAIGVDGQGNFFTLGALSDVVIGKDMVYDSTLTTSISEIPNGSIPLTISPNPNNGTFDLFFDKTAAASQISVFDFSGKIFWEESIPIHSDRHTVDLSGGFPSGIYFVKWVLADGRFAVRKVVVK